ncbi:unnamed protein product [Phytophthora fragariaefolia]|uniref:Unnamed protein product n=1 Tax=Phytophthora fragariaefolia TaxID=1490495 RepID=A0A9W6TY30_9STRA|nr:unnamed protein product [Phytophthora fragariaefolia]
MHSKGLIHGDLKCDNILVSGGTNPQAKICDFDRSFDWSALKVRRLVQGTAVDAGIKITDAVRYLAPECVEGMLPNSKSDVYPFGITLYHALTGVSPYSNISNEDELRASKLARELPSKNVQSINDDAWKLISQCCDPSPDERPTMEKVLDALKILADQLPVSTIPVEVLVNAAVDIQTDQINMSVPTTHTDDRTPVKSRKSGSRVIPRLHKMIAATIVGVAVVGIVVGILVGMKPYSSAKSKSSSTGLGLTFSSSSSNSGSSVGLALASSASASDSNSGSTSTSTSKVYGRQVSTILSYNQYYLWGIAVASNGQVYISAKDQILQMTGGNTLSALGPNGDLIHCDGLMVRRINTTYVSTITTLTDAMVLQGNAVDSRGNVYVSRLTEFDVVKITPDGAITSIATTSTASSLMMGITIDSSDNIYITDQHRVLKFTTTGEKTVLAGSETAGYVDAVGGSARFSTPWALTIGSDGGLYIADSDNNCIRKLNLTTTEVTTYAGICEASGSTDGLATNATFEMPVAIAAAADNVFYVVDGPYRQGYRLRKIYTV